MGLKVAIIGLSPTTYYEAPWDKPEWEKWGLPWDDKGWTKMSRHFEMHDMRLLKSIHSKRKEGYWERLNDYQRLYLQDCEPTLPNAYKYPYKSVSEDVGDYWNSSIAYALAMAIHEGAEEIGIYGVDMTGMDEYGYQKPNLEYLIGLARGRGIKVTIPDKSPLCKFNPTGIWFYEHLPTYKFRYGWLG